MLTKKSSRRQKASQILQKDAKFAPLFTAAYFGVMYFTGQNIKILK